MERRHIDHIPQETLEAIIDELASDRTSLVACCLVSRRWIWRSRNHLFKRIRFSSLCGTKSLRAWGTAMNPKGANLLLNGPLIIDEF